MKKVMFALCLTVGSVAGVRAQDSTSFPTENRYRTNEITQDQDRQKINSRDLPDAVKRSLENQEFRGWLVNTAYRTTGILKAPAQSDTTIVSSESDTTSLSSGAYGQEVYVVELKNGAQTKTVRFDKNGKKLDDPGMKDDQDDKDQN